MTLLGMPPGLIGALLGLVFGVGLVVVVVMWPTRRRPTLEDRVGPYVRRPQVDSGLLVDVTSGLGSFPLLRRLLRPVMSDAVRLVERVAGGPGTIEIRLRQAGLATTLEAFRVEQVVWTSIGALIGVASATGLVLVRGVPLFVAALVVLIGAILGMVGRDWSLSRQVRSRTERMLREFPTVAEMLALAVVAGEAPLAAMDRVARSSSGELPREFGKTVTEVRSGISTSRALHNLGRRTSLVSLARFSDGVAVALERGTPLADVLRAQAQDSRESAKRSLLETAGKREIAMLVPVVFLILPIVIVFAMFPGLAVLRMTL